jgi:hypothetical protein
VIDGELVVARRDPTTLLDTIEEPLDQIAGAVQIRAEADRIVAIAFRWDVNPSAFLDRKLSDPVRVVAPVCKQHRSGFETSQKFTSKPIVMSLTGEGKPYGEAIGVDERMNLACQSAPRPSNRLSLVTFDACSVLMDADNGGVDHLDRRFMGSCKCIYDPAPDPSPSPANEAVVAGGVRTKRFRQIAPGCSRSQDPENAVEDATVVYPTNATGLVGQHRIYDRPFMVGEFAPVLSAQTGHQPADDRCSIGRK